MCYTYDDLNRVTSRTIRDISSDVIISTETFSYDAAGNITDGEWEAALQSRLNALTQINDNPSGLDRFYTNRSIMGVTLTPEDEREAILSLSREEVTALARECALDTVFFLKPTREGCDDDED